MKSRLLKTADRLADLCATDQYDRGCTLPCTRTYSPMIRQKDLCHRVNRMEAKMTRSILLLLAVQCSFATAIYSDDYVLRIDTMGYVDASGKEPRETLLHSIETVVRPQVPFRCKAIFGTKTLNVAGKLLPADHGEFRVQIRYTHAVETGIPVLVKDGVYNPVDDVTAVETTVTMAVGESVPIAGFKTTVSQPSTPQRETKTRCILSLTECEPTAVPK